jgi:hypothetical protein
MTTIAMPSTGAAAMRADRRADSSIDIGIPIAVIVATPITSANIANILREVYAPQLWDCSERLLSLKIADENTINARDGSVTRSVGASRNEQGARLNTIATAAVSVVIAAFGVCLVVSTISNRSPRLSEWANHRWFIQQQSESIAQTGLPTYFVQSIETGLFYPLFVFYGSSLYAWLGYISQVFGVGLSYSLVWPIGLTVSGVFGFLAVRWLGCSKIQQLSLGLAFATYPYLITNGFSRFALTEFIALAAIPIYVAGITCLFTKNHFRVRAVTMVVIGAAGVTGSHNITSVWGLAIATVILIVLALTIPSQLFSKALLLSLLGTVAGIGLNAWFLIPGYMLRNTISITTASAQDFYSMRDNNLVSPQILFSLYPAMPAMSGTPHLNTNLPTPFIVIVVGFIAAMTVRLVLRPRAMARRNSRVPRRLMVVLGCPLVLLIAVLLFPQAQGAVPSILAHAQFTYRLVGISSILVLLLCGVMERVIPLGWLRPYVLLVLLASVTQAGFATYYVANALPSTVPTYLLDEIGSHAPPTLYGLNAYRDLRNATRAPAVAVECYLSVDPSTINNETFNYDSRSSGLCTAGSNTILGDRVFGTNTVFSPFVAAEPPARIVGADSNGFVLVSLPKAYPQRFTIYRRIPASASWGIALSSAIAAIGIACLVIILARRICGHNLCTRRVA